MNSKKETAEHKSGEDAKKSLNNQKTSCKCHKVLWNPSSECETYRTVVVNYNMGHKHNTWAEVVAALSDHKDSKAGSECDIYNLRKLYRMSPHSLSISNSNTSSAICEASTSSAFMDTSIDCGKNRGSRHSIRVDIFDMPPLQEPRTEEHLLVEEIAKDLQDCKTPSNLAASNFSETGECLKRKHAKNRCSATHRVKVEVFNLPLVQEATPEEIQATYSEIIPEQADIIVISSGDEEVGNSDLTKISEIELDESDNIRLEPETSEAGRQLDQSSTKTTQKPEIPTQTEMLPNLSQIPSSSSSVHFNSLARSCQFPSTHKQRQLELHRLRVQVEKKRLELLEMKLKRERDEMMRERIFFDKELETKRSTFKELNPEMDV